MTPQDCTSFRLTQCASGCCFNAIVASAPCLPQQTFAKTSIVCASLQLRHCVCSWQFLGGAQGARTALNGSPVESVKLGGLVVFPAAGEPEDLAKVA